MPTFAESSVRVDRRITWDGCSLCMGTKSAGGVYDSYDNALAETISGLYKAEVIHPLGPSRSFEALECATLEWDD